MHISTVIMVQKEKNGEEGAGRGENVERKEEERKRLVHERRMVHEANVHTDTVIIVNRKKGVEVGNRAQLVGGGGGGGG